MTGKMKLTVELAGVAMEVTCRHEENAAFLAAYRTDRAPAFSVEPGEEDLIRAREALKRQKEKEGIPGARFADRFVENNALHALICEKLAAEFGTLLFHGSALCADGEAILFTAPSGTGKSTQARLWRETLGDRVWMINDDKPLLRRTEGRVRAFGTPWDGKHHLSRNASAPLRAILEVRRSRANRIERISPAEAFVVCARQGFLSERPETRARVFAAEKELCREIPFYRLWCNMDPEAVRVAWEGVTGTKLLPGSHPREDAPEDQEISRTGQEEA